MTLCGGHCPGWTSVWLFRQLIWTDVECWPLRPIRLLYGDWYQEFCSSCRKHDLHCICIRLIRAGPHRSHRLMRPRRKVREAAYSDLCCSFNYKNNHAHKNKAEILTLFKPRFGHIKFWSFTQEDKSPSKHLTFIRELLSAAGLFLMLSLGEKKTLSSMRKVLLKNNFLLFPR